MLHSASKPFVNFSLFFLDLIVRKKEAPTDSSSKSGEMEENGRIGLGIQNGGQRVDILRVLQLTR